MDFNIMEMFLMAYLVFTEIRNYIERKNLMNRLMARDFPEYVTYENDLKRVNIKDKLDDPRIVL